MLLDVEAEDEMLSCMTSDVTAPGKLSKPQDLRAAVVGLLPRSLAALIHDGGGSRSREQSSG